MPVGFPEHLTLPTAIVVLSGIPPPKKRNRLFLLFRRTYVNLCRCVALVSVKPLNALAKIVIPVISQNFLVLTLMNFLRAVCVRHVRHMTLCFVSVKTGTLIIIIECILTVSTCRQAWLYKRPPTGPAASQIALWLPLSLLNTGPGSWQGLSDMILCC